MISPEVPVSDNSIPKDLIASGDKQFIGEFMGKLCEDVNTYVVDGKAGVTDEQRVWLEEFSGKCSFMKTYYEKKEKLEGILDDPEISDDEKKKAQEIFIKAYSKAKLRRVEEYTNEGMDTSDKTQFGIELYESIAAIFKYLRQAYGEFRQYGPDGESVIKAELGARANIEFTDLITKVGNDHNVKTAERVFEDMFGRSNVKMEGEFKFGKERNFASGLRAVMNAYMFIDKEYPGGKMRAPTFDEDVKQATDLIWEPKDGGEGEIKVFEIKSSNMVDSIALFDLRNEDHKKLWHELNERYRQIGDGKMAEKRKTSFDEIVAAAEHKGTHPYWIEVPWNYVREENS